MEMHPNRTRRNTKPRWTLIESWEGNDSRFHHRDGGEPHGGSSWIDRFEEVNPAVSLISIRQKEDLLTLSAGKYKVFWDCEVIFKSPACNRPSTSKIAIQLVVTRMSGTGQPQLAHHRLDQVYICSNIDGLKYEDGIEAKFRCQAREESLDFSLYAYNDASYGGGQGTNIQEIIVHSMELYKKD